MVKGFGLPLPRQTLFKYVRGFSPNHMLDVDRNLIWIWSQKCTCERARQIGVARGGMCCLFSFFCCSCSACVLVFLCFSPALPFSPFVFPDRKIWRRQAFDDSTTHSYRFQSAPDFQNWFPDEKSNGVSKEKITNTPQATQGCARSPRCRQCQ